MPKFSNEPVEEVRARLLRGMREFMEPDEEDEDDEDYDCGYALEDVEACARIIDAFLGSLPKAARAGESEVRAAVQEAVQEAVLALNALNDECEGCLIETEQREDLCQLLLVAAKGAGLQTDEDITEAWREW